MHVVHLKPTIGDYVSVARTHGPRTNLSTNLVGSRRFSRILSDCTVEIEHLQTNATAIVDICPVKSYAVAPVGASTQKEEIAEFTDCIWHPVDKIKRVREGADHFEVLVAWKALTRDGDS